MRPTPDDSRAEGRDLAVEAVIEAELRLLDPEVRTSPELTGALLHPGFHEFGASGRHWDRASIIASLAATTEPGAPRIAVSRMTGVQLAPDLIHLTFDTENNGRRAHRSSLWRRNTEDGGWLLYFHQATPFHSENGDENGDEEG
ncbi:nuclear transport factor 2 family protein [Streptomyces sp. ME02-8801-2C]|uniref:nuclear transport factor 2 family protein n=1 Tax=Streptomyces sp. ME02-8801-2C TaxID=3028680 RepID=UPI0029ADFE50|nr:nuclear transport factor 2 family protein [Streptomyces sp. ME02-8801-2C]MDX3451095.1 nuclear transport factor 2 family protein [Streptomyces sp. ME02-8801-2C]